MRARGTRLVLVVEDDPDSMELVVEVLQLAGFRAEAATDGRGALQKAETISPDVILLDVSLPDVDGIEVVRRLRANPVTVASRWLR